MWRPRPPRPRPRPSWRPSARPAAASPVAAQRQGTREGLDIDAPNGASQDYASRLRAWLEAHKTYPKRARMRREEGVVHVHFAVDRQGRLLAGDITRSSGHASLDTEALAMLGRSNPFPGAPHTVRGERIEVSTPVEFYLTR
jgi:protein TonB